MKTSSNRTFTSMTLAILTATVSVFSILFLTCSNSPVAAGAGSGTGVGNGFAMGKVIYADSTPVVGAIVRLRPQSFLADTTGMPTNAGPGIAIASTDSTGAFRIHSIDTALTYSLEVNNEKDSAKGTLYKFSLDSTDTARLETRIVTLMPRVVGAIKLFGLPQNAYVQIYGLERIGRTDSLGSFEIDELPVGKCEEKECEYTLHVLARQPDGSFKASIYELELTPDISGNVIHVELELENLLPKQRQ